MSFNNNRAIGNLLNFLLLAVVGAGIYVGGKAASTHGRRAYETVPAMVAVVPERISEPLEDITAAAHEKTSMAGKLKSFQNYEHVNAYDGIIIEETQRWNDYFARRFSGFKGVDPNVFKSMIVEETGSKTHTGNAFKYDPMQIANKGDYALTELQKGIPRLGDFETITAPFQGKKCTPRRNGRWDHSALAEDERMTAQLSIKGGILWFLYKGFIYDSNGGIVGQRDIEETLERYNGSSRKGDYVEAIMMRLVE